jgi:serine protease Do
MTSFRTRILASGVAVGAATLAVLTAAGSFAQGEPAASPAAPAAPVAAGFAPGAPSSFADIVAKVAPAVVSIDVVEKAGPSPVALQQGEPMIPFPFGFGGPGQGDEGPGGQALPPGFSFKWLNPQAPDGAQPRPVQASGSGFFISADGYVVTNNHVVKDAEKITVRTSDDRKFTARVIGRDPATDLAVIKVTGGPFPYVDFENRARPRVGDWVVAVGNPFGLGGTATAGIVSALGRQNVSDSNYVDYMQIDAPINRGNSGGPTFDLAGHVVGVNTAIFSPSGGSVGIGFDIPADVTAQVTRQLIDHGEVVRGYIGATVQTLTDDLAESLGSPQAKGGLVDQLTPGGPAERAGLRSGDVILSVNGETVDNSQAVTRRVALAHPGDEIVVGVLRNGARLEVRIKAGARPAEPSLASYVKPDAPETPAPRPGALGVEVAPDPQGGLVVRGVDPKSDAAAKGLREGDVILRAGQHQIASAADLAQAIAEARQAGRNSVPLLIARDGQKVFLPVRLSGGQG